MLKMLLKKHNVIADTAENGKLAVDMVLAKPENYQLVFMDNLMPVMVRLRIDSLRSIC
jgi:CheY-like chemotaxis protein